MAYFFLPLNFTCTLGIIGFFIYLVKKSAIVDLKEQPKIKYVLTILIPVAIIALVSILINLSNDLYFFKWAIINMFYAFGAYTLVRLLKNSFGYFDFHLLIKLLTICAVCQVSLALVMFLNPGINTILQSLIKQDEVGTEVIKNVGELRMLGFGTYFFGAGLTHGVILMLIGMELCNPKLKLKEISLYLVAYLFITIVSTLMSRTTTIGASIGLVIVLISRLGSFKSFKKLLLSIVVTVLVVIIGISAIPSSILGQYEDITRFGFEMFYNYQETGSFTTVSTEHMFEDMVVFPSNEKTWIIGDALWSDPHGNGYYMHTDIGYCKLIFYFGLLGTIIYFLFQIVFIKRVFPFSLYGIVPFIAFLSYVLIINLKGLCDLYPLIILCYICKGTYSDFPKFKLLSFTK